MKNEKINKESKVQDAKPPPYPSPLPLGGGGGTDEETETEYDTLDPISANRNGKIATLSRDIRESLNRRIRRGQPGPDILEWLNAEPSVVEVLDKRFESKPVTRQNLWEWRHGGYKEWARNRAACFRLNHKRKGKRIDRHQLGDEMAQLYAEELTVTLDELIDFAPDSEVRMQRLEKGLNQIRGWRRSDYHAQRMVLQIERMVLDREKLQWRAQCQSQELAVKEKRMALDQDRFERTHAEYIVNTCNNPLIKAAARKKGVSYAHKVKEVDTIMFGKPTEQTVVQPSNGGTVESAGKKAPTPDLQVPAKNQTENIKQPIRHGPGNIRHPVNAANGGAMIVQRPTGAADPQPLPNNSQPTRTSEMGDEIVPQPNDGKALQNEQNEAVLAPLPSPSVVPGRPQNEMENESSPESEVQSPKPGNFKPQSDALRSDSAGEESLPDSENLQPSTCNLEPSAEGSMTVEQADTIASEWKAKAKSFGGIIINNWDVAELSAYLSGQPRPWYSLQSSDHETMYPPPRDPRYNPESPWCRAWNYIEQERRANEKN